MSRPPVPVSVVIPTYNRAAYLRQALESVAAQTVEPQELIVVDDGSDDATRDVVAGAAPGATYLHQPNRGVASARNRGVRAAAGDWVAFLDSDDRWEPGALETLYRAARSRPDVGLFAVRCRLLSADGTVEGRVLGKRTPGAEFTTAGLLGPDTSGVLTPMVRRSVLLESGGFDETMRSAEDCDLWIRLSFRTRMLALPEPLLLRRRHDGNLRGDRGLNARMWLRILEKLRRDHPDFVRGHPREVRRAVGKEHLRLGRTLVRTAAGDRTRVREGRHHLLLCVRSHPWFPRAYLTLLRSLLP